MTSSALIRVGVICGPHFFFAKTGRLAANKRKYQNRSGQIFAGALR